MATKLNERLQSVDVAKGVGVVAIACFHAVGFSAGGSFGSVVKSLHACFGGVLGVFFFLSGYFYKPGRSYGKNVLHRTKNLLLPTLILAAVICIIGYFAEWISEARVPIDKYICNYLRFIVDPYAFQPFSATTDSIYNNTRIYYFLLPLWFAYRLYFSDLIFYALVDWALKNFLRLTIAVISLLTTATLYIVFVPVHFAFQLECCCAYAALIIVGAYCGKFGLLTKLENDLHKKEYWYLFLGITILYILSLIFLKDYFGQRLFCGMFNTQLKNGPEAVYFWFICQIIMCYVTMFFCSMIAKLPGTFLKPILYCGNGSMLILALHSVLEWVVVRCFGNDNETFLTRSQAQNGFTTETGVLILSAIVTILICCLVYFFIGRITSSRRSKNAKSEA